VLRLVARGLSNKEVARAIGRTSETVKIHLRNIYAKLGADDRLSRWPSRLRPPEA
jgi:DNA-binding NarL/FixJ family response regulator